MFKDLLEIDGVINYKRIAKLNHFMDYVEKGVVYNVSETDITDFTDPELEYIKRKYKLNFYHNCGVIYFYDY